MTPAADLAPRDNLALSNVPVRGKGNIAPSALVTVARATRRALPTYVTRAQVHAMVAECETTRDRLVLATLWQTGGRASEVCALRLREIDRTEGAITLTNLKQRGARRHMKLVYVSHDLVGALLAFARDTHCPEAGYLFRSNRSDASHISRQHLRRLVRLAGQRAGVVIASSSGDRLPTPLDFRHGAAVHLLREGLPLTEVQEQLGHARIDTTTIYTRMTDAERRRLQDRVTW